MPTVLENLQTAEANLATKIAEISANPKPNYSIDGQSVSHNDYLKMLIENLKQVKEAIAYTSPFVIKSQVW
jgi:hypothetical protein